MPGNPIIQDLEEKIQTCREQQFTGVVQVGAQQDHIWQVYYLLGRIVWTRSRTHSLRRWQRHLAVHEPVFFEQVVQPASLSYKSWNYAAIARLVKLKQFRRSQFYAVVESCIAEDLFDILQAGTWRHQQTGQPLTYTLHAEEAANLPFIMLQQERAWQDAQQAWQDWEQAKLTQVSPNWALAITDLNAVKAQTPPQALQTLTTFADGKSTLRDLSINFKQPIIPLAKSLFPYVSRKLLHFTEIPNLLRDADNSFYSELVESNRPVASPQSTNIVTGRSRNDPLQNASLQDNSPSGGQPPPKTAASVPRPGVASPSAASQHTASQHTASQRSVPLRRQRSNAPTIVYIDDSPADSRAMSQIIEGTGYQYTNIPDPLQALPLLIELKPALIFLDLVMPIANGYEVCAQIRRMSTFKDIPVIIVTSNDGIADRVRAKVVGASGFLGKPIQSHKVTKVLKKHLHAYQSLSS